MENRENNDALHGIFELSRPDQYFGRIPQEKVNRILYVRRMQAWFGAWSLSDGATKHPENSKVTFRKLIDHTLQWLDYTDTDPVASESTCQMFFDLMRERFFLYFNTPSAEDHGGKKPESADEETLPSQVCIHHQQADETSTLTEPWFGSTGPDREMFKQALDVDGGVEQILRRLKKSLQN